MSLFYIIAEFKNTVLAAGVISQSASPLCYYRHCRNPPSLDSIKTAVGPIVLE